LGNNGYIKGISWYYSNMMGNILGIYNRDIKGNINNKLDRNGDLIVLICGELLATIMDIKRE